MKNWEETINAKQDGKSVWKEQLNQINDHVELLDLFTFLSTEMQKEINKFYEKKNSAAGRRARNNAQKIKDVMSQIRVVVQNQKA